MDSDLKSKYKKWLKAAYIYYIRPGDETGMSDYTWDMLGKELYENKDQLVGDEYKIIHEPDYQAGQSLYWVREIDYPDYCRN